MTGILFNPEISLGSILSLFVILGSLAGVYSKITNRLSTIESWMREHEKSDRKEFEAIRREINHVTSNRATE